MTTASLFRTTRPQWRTWITQHAWYYREAAIVTFALGIYLHVSRIVFGDKLLMQYLLTPTFDKIHAIPMTYAAVAGFVGWKHLRFQSRVHRIVSMVILGFIAISVPLHVATYFGVSMARFSVFPGWYSLLEGVVLYPFFFVSVWRLRLSDTR